MSEEKFSVEDMSLETDKDDRLDMDLEGPDSVEIGDRLAKLFPGVDLIDLIGDLKIVKMANGSYTINSVPLKEIESWDLEKIDAFLKSKGG